MQPPSLDSSDPGPPAPLDEVPEYSLEELIALVTDENLYPEIDSGPSAGNEAW